MKTLLATICLLLAVSAKSEVMFGDASTNTVIAVASDLVQIRTDIAGTVWNTNQVGGASATVVAVNDDLRPRAIIGPGGTALSLSIAGYGATAGIIEISGCSSVTFPADYIVYGGTFQTNRVNCFAVWTTPRANFAHLYFSYEE